MYIRGCILLLPALMCTGLTIQPTCQYHEAPHRQIEEQDLEYGLHKIVEDDELTLGCTDGYKLNGDSFVYCDIGGIWDPPVLPQCEEIQCELPKREHLIMRLDGTDTPLPAGTFITYNQQVACECEEGYRLRLYSSALVVCNSHWHIPSCQAIRCPRIDRPEHGDRVIYNNPALRGPWRVGSSVVVECSDGYTLLGTRRRFCTAAGSWNGTLQICDNGRSTCRNPGRPIGGMKHGDNYNKGDMVSFTCTRGHTMLGSAERECLDNGEWTGEETRCIAANEHMAKEEALMILSNGIVKMSEKSIDTKMQKEKMNDLMGKHALLGKNRMEYLNPYARSTIRDLRNLGGLDVYFVLDTSGSIPQYAKNMSIQIIKRLVELVGVSAEDDGTGFGFMAFDSEVWERVIPGEKTDSATIFRFLEEFKREMINRPKRGTSPAAAFRTLKVLLDTRIMLGNTRGMTNRSSAIILLSDGNGNEGGDPAPILKNTVNQAKAYNHQIHVYCIGVGDTNLNLLRKLATPGSDYLMFLKDLIDLDDVVDTLYNGNRKLQQCGVQGQQDVYTGNISDVSAIPGTWRWVGGLYMYTGDGHPSSSRFQFEKSKFRCGVSLISKGPNITESDWVLTAAHCVANVQASNLMVKFGSLHSSTTAQDSTVVRVAKIIRHPGYRANTMVHDIAVLQLKTTIPFAYDIQPICLHKPNEDFLRVGAMTVMTGWGQISENDADISPTLKQLSARIVSNTSCTNSTLGTNKSKFTYPFNFCAGNVMVANQLLDACKFDSGSPLVKCHKTEGLNRICTQVGIVSYGDGCGRPGKFGVYTNTTTYYHWIMSKIVN